MQSIGWELKQLQGVGMCFSDLALRATVNISRCDSFKPQKTIEYEIPSILIF